VKEHHDELVEEDRYVEERIEEEIAQQTASGLYREIDRAVPVEERMERLREKLRCRQKEDAERNGIHLHARRSAVRECGLP
jgi:hypothetical protein